jgi:hypothetical protein
VADGGHHGATLRADAQLGRDAIELGTGPAAEVSATATAFSNTTGLSGPSERPRYLDRGGAPALTATAGPAGGFVNVPSGFYAVQFQTSSWDVRGGAPQLQLPGVRERGRGIRRRDRLGSGRKRIRIRASGRVLHGKVA